MKITLAVLIVGAIATSGLPAFHACSGMQEASRSSDASLAPGGKWHVHDNKRPHPPIVAPPGSTSQNESSSPPTDAVVLFNGADLSKWRKSNGEAAGWKVENGYMEVVPNAGDIVSREMFGDCQIHVEWAAPTPPKGEGQSRGNSGVFLMDQYEIQVLDSYENQTYADGQAAAIYGQYPPLVNASRKPGEWQSFDILFNPARFRDGRLEEPGYVTVLHNGIVVHNHTALTPGDREGPKAIQYEPNGPIRLQEHGAPVRYRNIWVRHINGYDEH